MDDKFPEFELQNKDGAMVKSEDLLSRGAMVVVFYRGFWYLPPPPLASAPLPRLLFAPTKDSPRRSLPRPPPLGSLALTNRSLATRCRVGRAMNPTASEIRALRGRAERKACRPGSDAWGGVVN